MTDIRSIVALTAAALFAVAAQAEPTVAQKNEDRPAASQPAPQSSANGTSIGTRDAAR